MKDVADGASGEGARQPVAYKYVRIIASQGQEPSAEVRRQVALWGWKHVRELIDRLAALDAEVAAAMAEMAAGVVAARAGEDADPSAG